MRSGNRARGVHRRRGAAALLAAGLLAVTPGIAGGTAPVAESQIPFAPAYEGVLAGDLAMAANSNLLSAGGWRRTAAADVDGDASRLCLGRLFVRGDCTDNSSSAVLDIPAGARVVHARLYVQTSLSSAYGPMRVRLDGPTEGYTYTEIGPATKAVPQVAEGSAASGRAGPTMRQAVWDVTEYVAAAGSGTYTVADIVSERAGAFMPYASWAIVAAYELDPAADLAVVAPTPEAQQRFAFRALSWHDGFVARSDAPLEVVVNGFAVDAAVPVFAKSFHIVGHAPHGGAENLLFNGKPLGNNVLPGAAATPAGVTIGTDPTCNSISDVLNDSICNLGAPVATKLPGPSDYVAVRDGRTPTSGSAVDMDVVRIPDRYFLPGATTATLTLDAAGDEVVAAGMLAVSVDLPPPTPLETAP
jgi:hypothetical protein